MKSLKPKDYRLNEFIELISYFGGEFNFIKPIRFNETPHTPTVKVYKLSINDDFEKYGEFRDGIIQRLKWEKHLKQKDEHRRTSPDSI